MLAPSSGVTKFTSRPLSPRDALFLRGPALQLLGEPLSLASLFHSGGAWDKASSCQGRSPSF